MAVSIAYAGLAGVLGSLWAWEAWSWWRRRRRRAEVLAALERLGPGGWSHHTHVRPLSRPPFDQDQPTTKEEQQ